MGPRMLRVLGFGALALRGHALGIADWGLVSLLAVVVSTFLGLEAEVEGSRDLRGLSIVLKIGCLVQVVEFHYAAMIIQRLAIGIGVKWSQAGIMIKCAI